MPQPEYHLKWLLRRRGMTNLDLRSASGVGLTAIDRVRRGIAVKGAIAAKLRRVLPELDYEALTMGRLCLVNPDTGELIIRNHDAAPADDVPA